MRAAGSASLYRILLGAVEEVDEEVGWPLFERAGQEGVEGLFYWRCLAAGTALPRALARRLRGRYRRTAAANFAALQALGGVLEGLAAQGIEVLVLPGAALLPFYPDPGCRSMEDIDVLVDADDFERVDAFLRREGFERPPRHGELFARRELVLDLHTDLINCTRIRARRYAGWMDLEEVWRDRRRRAVEGVPLCMPGLEDMALYTAVHALRHSFGRLLWFLDLHLLLRQEAMCWERLADKAGRYRLERPLWYGLCFLQEQLGLSPAPAARAWMAGRRPGAAEAYLLRRSFSARGHGEWGELLWSFNIRGPAQRCRFLAETLFPQPAVLLQVFPYLPRFLAPLAYGLRLLQLLRRGGRQLAVLVRGS